VPSLHACRSTLEDPHSFFTFEPRPYLPEDKDIKLFSKTHYKRKIIEKTERIVIDEISMVRADIIEAMDYSLRNNGGNPFLPFGGKQIVMVGDVFQLPPIIKGTELEFVIMVIAVSCVKLLSAHNSTQHTSRKHKV
jgi:hypothetical protein